MAEQVTLQQAVQALKKQFGDRIEAGQDEGRNLMAEALEQALNVSKDRARGIVQDLEEAHSVRWMTQVEQGAQGAGPAILAPGPFDPETARVVAALPTQGYWQL
jgi:hypothetical protein